MGLVWDLPEPAGRAGAPALSRERIVRAALEIADADGTAAVTMRRVAAALGSSTPMSLYRYVGGKDGILDLMLDAVYAEIDLPARPGGDWRADLTLLARNGGARCAGTRGSPRCPTTGPRSGRMPCGTTNGRCARSTATASTRPP
jgi:AcrR family transcriptional regulator